MKLNADIIYDGLSAQLSVEMAGQKETELRLGRPVFYDGGAGEFAADRLYITRADRLPRRAAVQRGAVILCQGDSVQLAYYRERCCVIRVRDDTDIFTVFNLVQGLFDRFDSWKDDLQEIMDRSASVEEMIIRSRPIFMTSMFLLDANFKLLAHCEAEGGEALIDAAETENLGLERLGKYLEGHELATQEREPIILELLDTATLNVNLFDQDTYIGCLTLDYKSRMDRAGDIELAKVLADMLAHAMLKFSSTASTDHSLLRAALQGVVDGMPVDYSQRRVLENALHDKEYICVKMELSSRFAKLPAGYICNEVERRFPHSVAFERKGSVLCFIDTAGLPGGDCQAALEKALGAFTGSMDLKVGVSDAFADVYSARLYYHQASAALENGNLVAPGRNYYRFQDYALTELVINSLGKMPTELFFSDGMRRLAAHDTEASVSYLDTLRAYLDQNMSMTKTAAALYVHRSTLLERIARIERELDTDLKDPDERLRIQILLKAMKIHEAINETRTEK